MYTRNKPNPKVYFIIFYKDGREQKQNIYWNYADGLT